MSLLSTSHTFSFKRTKNILHTILLSICFVFANSAFATSNPSSSISQNTEVYLVTTDWIDSSSTLIFNPVSEKYFLSKTESSNNSLVFSQPFPNPDTDGDGIEDAIDLDDDNDGISDTVELLSIDAALWLDASDPSSITKDSNGLVSQWNDKSGNNNHATQGSSGNQPAYQANGWDGTKPALYLDGSNDNMTINGTYTNNSGVAIMVYKPDNDNLYGLFTASRNSWTLYSNNSSYESTFRTVRLENVANGQMSSNDPNIYMIEANSSAPIYTMYRDGTSIYSTTGNFTFEDNITALNYGGRNLKGWIAETILLDDIPSQEERQKIEGYLAHKWGLAASLPADHPYKNAVPTSDLDGDGIPNSRDLDSDGDGIPDNIEAQTTAGYTVPGSTIDNTTGINTTYGSGLTPIDTDADGTPDYLDIDSDNDQTNDNTEAKVGGLTLSNVDADNDGLDDDIDTDDNNFGPVNAGITNVLNTYPNTTALNDASLVDVQWRVDCPFGKISTEQYASTSLGGWNIGATVPSPNVEGAPDGVGQDLYSGGGSAISLEYDTTFSGDAVVTIKAKYYDSRQGYIFFEASSDGTSYETVSSNLSGFGTSYSSQSFTIPASFTDNFKYLRIGRQTGNTMYMNVDAVKVAYEICNDCPTGIDAPVLSATTITNSCPTQTMDLTSITASNLPANTSLTWHTGIPATDANKVSAPATAAADVYYASFYSETESCYTLDGEAVTAVTADGDSDCDGVPNSTDIDDDNDGVLDTEEGICNLSGEQVLLLDDITLSGGGSPAKSTVTNYVAQQTPAGSEEPSGQTFVNGFDNNGGVDVPFTITFNNPTTFNIANNELTIKFQYYDNIANTTSENINHYPSFNIETDAGDFFVDYTLTAAEKTSLSLGNWIPIEFTIAIAQSTVTINSMDLYLETISGGNSGSFSAAGSEVFALAIDGIQTGNSCIDTDGDGIPNSLDLDSDADGCSDALEAGATTNTTADYVFTGAVGANGLVDTLETSVDSGTINYTSTYSPYAVSDFLAACVDTDSDGVNDLLDIDDDNDGILDATESPSCFYLAGEFENGDRTEFVEVTTTLSMNATYNDLNETVDGVNGTGSADYAVRFTNSQSAIDQTVYQFEFQQAVELSTIYIGYINGNSHFINGASIKLQASNNNANWLDVNDGATYNQANSNSNVPSVGTIRNQAFEVTKNAGVYKYYRIQGVSGTIWDGGYSNEIYFETNNFNASLYPKDNCSVDTDGDGTYNHLDTDSDGDTCIDTIEANAQDDGDTGDANNNGLLDKYEDGTTGTISYSSTYGLALDDNANACADTDGDGIGDLIDLDDDNDGILDIDEQVANNCQYLGTTTDFNGYTFNNDTKVAVTAVSENSITVNRISGSWVSTYSNKTYSLPMRLSFTVDNVNSASMIGLIGTSQNKDFTNWSTKSHLFYFSNASSYDIRDEGATRTGGSYASGDEFIIDIDSSGNLVMTQNGQEKWTDTVTDTEFQFVLSTASTTPKPYNNIFLNDGVDNLPYGCTDIDTDGDTIPNRLDLDSDGDGCSDSIEGVSPIPASPWSPAEITTSVWLDAADASTITADGNGISQWDDKSGNDHHAVQTNNSYKPAHVQNDLDGKDGVDFYLNKSLRKNTGTQTVGYVIAVLKAENAIWNHHHTIFGRRTDARFGGFMQINNTGFHNNVYPGSVWVDGTSQTVSTTGFSTIDSPHIWSYTPNGNTVKTLTGGYSMGNYDNVNAGGSATQYEVVVLPTIPTDQEREKLEGYLAHKWDLAANLPVDHPYKNAAPESSNLVGGGSGATCNIFTKPSNNSTSVYNTGDDTNTNGLLDAFEGTEAGTTNYTSRYVAYALDNSINACTDSDGDDVGDIFDLDDDNDGVLDTTEGTGDTDNDGTPNHLDTDSDGDGCLDTIEAGTTNNGATTDANCNGLLDQYEDGVTNNINYTSTYNPYALNNTVNSCVDTDSDGVNDVFDIDDDNDGVLDTEEGCQILAYDLTTLTWDTDTAMTVTTADSSTLQGTSTSGWKSALSTQTFSLPLDISFTYSETTREVMVGFAEEDSDLGTSWNTATAFGFYIYNTNTKARYNNTNGGTVTSNSNGKTHRIVIDTAGNLTTYIDGQLTYQQTGLSTDQYKVYIAHNSGTNKPLENVALRTANYPLSCELDTDSDGTPNGLDLDSDGDGCSDALEAGATTNTTADYVFTGAVGANGLVDALETTVDSGTINYTSTYSPNAVSDFLAGCVDTDSDGVNDLLDIDDDNDGVLDATESPSCYYLAGEITSNMSVSTTIATYNTTSWGIQNTIDNNTGTRVQYNRITSIVGEEVFKLEFITPIKLASLELDMSDYPISGVSGTYVNTTILQGSLNGTNWFDLQTAATSLTTTNGIETIQNTEQPNTAYQYYRLLGVTGRPDHGRIKEITPILNNFNASLYPKDNCSVDTDGDGTYNHLDTDSDGDSCLDTIEAGTSDDNSTTDANNNGLLDQYEDGTTGTINYTSTYSTYAINNAINACTDTDDDGVNDVFDLDDDNDGILDTVELLSIDAALWLDASDPSSITKDSNGLVSQWNDKSGNGHHATQSTTDNQPTTTAGTITFDGNDKLELPHGVIPDPTESSMVFMVGLSGAQTSPYNGFLSNGRATLSQSYSIRTNGSNMYWYAFNNDLNIPLTTPYTNLSIYGIDLNTASNTVKAYQNGELKATKNAFTGVVNTGTEAGLIGVTPGSSGTNNEFLVGEIREIIVVKSQLSLADRQKIEGYLAHKWGLEGSLPTDHPYKDAAPSSDIDGDGIPNSRDLDSDGDGIPDNIEAQTTAGYTVPGNTIDNTTGINTTYGSGLTPIDTDADGTPDFLDTDSDNAQDNDTTEAGVTLSGADADNDGLDDGIDTDDNNFGPVNAGITNVLNTYPNTTALNDASLVDVQWRVDCPFGKVSTEQYVISATGNHSGSWGTDNGVIGAPDEIGATGTTANRISLHRNLVTLTYQDIFSGGATITMYARHWSGYTGGFTMAFSEDNSTWTSESSSQNVGSASYTTLNYTVPNNLNGNYKYIRLTYDNVGGNTLTLIDAVKVTYEFCNDCPTGIDAPVLSATTITNSCPTANHGSYQHYCE